MSAGVTESAEVLQMPGCDCDTLSAPTQHIRDEFLGHQELRVAYTVVA